MVRLIQIERLGPRIEGMLYKSTFDETWSLLDDVGLLSPMKWMYLYLLLGGTETFSRRAFAT